MSLEMLNQRAEERTALLDRITQLLRSDRRVVAAWLGGSLGRGSADALSDIDLYVVIAEQYIRIVGASTTEFVGRIPGLLVVQTADVNAPPDGAYLTTLYHGSTGPHQVDWYLLSHRKAAVPAAAKVLFNDTSVPAAPMQLPAMEEFDTANEAAFFWALAGITAKEIAREKPWSVVTHLSTMRCILSRLQYQLGVADVHPGHLESREDSPPVTGQDQLDELQRLIDEMSELAPQFAMAEVQSPAQMADELAPLIKLVEEMLVIGSRNADKGGS